MVGWWPLSRTIRAAAIAAAVRHSGCRLLARCAQRLTQALLVLLENHGVAPDGRCGLRHGPVGATVLGVGCKPMLLPTGTACCWPQQRHCRLESKL